MCHNQGVNGGSEEIREWLGVGRRSLEWKQRDLHYGLNIRVGQLGMLNRDYSKRDETVYVLKYFIFK